MTGYDFTLDSPALTRILLFILAAVFVTAAGFLWVVLLEAKDRPRDRWQVPGSWGSREDDGELRNPLLTHELIIDTDQEREKP